MRMTTSWTGGTHPHQSPTRRRTSASTLTCRMSASVARATVRARGHSAGETTEAKEEVWMLRQRGRHILYLPGLLGPVYVVPPSRLDAVRCGLRRHRIVGFLGSVVLAIGIGSSHGFSDRWSLPVIAIGAVVLALARVANGHLARGLRRVGEDLGWIEIGSLAAEQSSLRAWSRMMVACAAAAVGAGGMEAVDSGRGWWVGAVGLVLLVAFAALMFHARSRAPVEVHGLDG